MSDFSKTLAKIELAIKYLEVLQRGRQKPDRNGGTFSESMDNIEDIREVKEFINSELLKTDN